MTIVRYNPNKMINRIDRNIEEMFNSFFANAECRSAKCDCFVPSVDVAENNEKVTIRVELPGMEKDAIKVSVEDGILNISGDRSFVQTEDKDQVLRSEIKTGEFSRSFTLADQIEVDKIKADYRDGLLIVELPKKEQAKPKEIEVNVN